MAPEMVADLARLADWVTRDVPNYLREDARQEAWLGALQALGRYDGTRKLIWWAERRASGQVKDFLRGEDPLSRSHRRRIKAGVATAIETVGFQERYHGCAPATQERDAVHGDVWRWLRFLPRQERSILAWRLRGFTLAQIARKIGLTTARIHQIEENAMKRIRIRVVEAPK